jgi:cytochrome c biogenesis protein
MPFFRALASLKLTLAGFLLLGVATVIVLNVEGGVTAWLAGPLVLMAVNLIAAVATNVVFRRQMALLVFHLALITLVLLAAIGRLTYFKGAADVTEGTAFSGVWREDAGPLHQNRLDRVAFVNEGFDIVYKPGPVRDSLHNQVRFLDHSGIERRETIADNQPLVLYGYRFYPTANKGYAPVLLWRPKQGEPVLGGVHMPSYPANRHGQARNWRPPGASEDIWVMLELPELMIPPDTHSRFRLPEAHKLILRVGEVRHEMRPGDIFVLDGGTVEYRELRTWMGYLVFYDWTIPWLLAACVLAIGSLGWHFWGKFAAKPWVRPEAEDLGTAEKTDNKEKQVP